MYAWSIGRNRVVSSKTCESSHWAQSWYSVESGVTPWYQTLSDTGWVIVILDYNSSRCSLCREHSESDHLCIKNITSKCCVQGYEVSQENTRTGDSILQTWLCIGRGPEAYTDLDWAGSKVDRRSSTAYCSMVGRNLVFWKSKKQSVLAKLSDDIEFSACELLWLKILLYELGFMINALWHCILAAILHDWLLQILCSMNVQNILK